MRLPSSSRREEWQEGILIALALPLILALAFVVFGCFRVFSVPSGSMLPDYGVGSYVVVSRLKTGFSRYTFDVLPLPLSGRWPQGEMKRGDVIVFRLPADHTTFFIKRVIGLPGDTVRIHAGRLQINGATVPRDNAGDITIANGLGEDVTTTAYLEALPGGATHAIIELEGDEGPADNTADYTVPGDHVFVMGDNRDNSNDSRHNVGMVPMDLINGAVVTHFRLPGSAQD